MFKLFLPLLLTTLLSANLLTTSSKVIALDEPFSVENNGSSLFDTSLSYTHKALLACTPALNAVYKVESDKKIRVIPRQRLKSGTDYSCHYKQIPLTFSTQAFRLVDYHYFKRDKLLRLTFNDTIDLERAKANIKLSKKDKLASTNLNYTITQHSEQTLLLKINEPVGKHAVELTIDKSLGLAEEFSASFNDKQSALVTLDDKRKPMMLPEKPMMVALDNGEFALRLFLGDTLEGTPENFIEIEGVENFRLDSNNYISYTLRKKYDLSEEVYYYTDVLSSEFKPNTTYEVTLKKGLRHYHELKNDQNYTVATTDRAKGIIFEDKKPYISTAGELGFKSVNIESATLIVERVVEDNLRYFMNFSGAKEKKVFKYTEEVYSKEITLDNQKNIITKQKFALADITSKLPYGVYNITLRYTEDEKEKSKSKVVFLSNLGIAVNLAKGQAFITVLSLDKAQPITSAKVELYGENNALIGTVKTNKDGVATINKENLLSSKPKGVIVFYNGDKNFLALNKTITSPSPDSILEKAERFKAHIYFQSKLVRPAGKVNALITIKDKDFISASKLPIKVTFQELYGRVLQEKVYHTDEYGLIDFNHQLDNDDRTGTYELITQIGDKRIGNERVKIESFLPPKIENHISTNKEAYHLGELIEANISSNYLFGAAASGLYGTVTLDSVAVDFEHKAFKHYSFSNHSLAKNNMQIYLEQREEIQLDNNGKLNIVLPTNTQQKVPSVLEAMVGVTIMDDTQPVSNYKKIMLYPYQHMVGVKIDKNHIEKGKELQGKAVLIDPISGKLMEHELYAIIKKVEWHYSYSSGNYEWEKEMTTIDSFSLKSNEAFSKTVGENGNYIIEIHDRLGGHSASSEFDVWWQEYSNLSPKDDLKSVEIHFEDRLYQKGDKLLATIKSPILKGELFVTLESDKVLYYERLSIDKGVAKVEIPIESDIKHGAYLHATAYRASDTSSALIPFRAMGYQYIKANRNAHKIDIKIDTPTHSKSKTTLKIGLSANKKSKVLVSIVDTGILQLARQEEPKIFEHFNQQPNKQLSYYDLYDQLLAYLTEGKLIDFGAGDIAIAKKQKHLPPDLGKRVKPFMLWSGIFELKDNNRSLGIDIPEFNGKATIIAIAINEDSLGVNSKELIVKDDIMIKPSYPKYTLAGDKIDVPIRIFNTTKTTKTITLSSKLSDNLSFDISESNMTIPANSSKLLNAKLTAKEVGKGEINIQASFGHEEVSKSVELPIYNPYAISTKTFKGISNKTETFTVPNAYKGAKVYLTLSDNLIGSMRDDLKYLIAYPYGCVEQTTSKLLAMHHANTFLANDTLVGESQNFIRQGIKKLRNMQNYYGEFSYWEEGGEVHPYASLYAAQTLLELKRDGVEIESSMIEKIIKMLKSVTTQNAQYLAQYSKFHRIYAAYILAEDHNLDASSANMLLEQKLYEKHFLSTYYLAAIFKMQGKEQKALELYNSMPNTLKSYTRNYGNLSGNFESNRRDMFLHFMVKSQYFKKEAKDLATVQQSLDELYSTQEKAMALKAISLYLGKPKKSKLDVTLDINGQSQKHTQAISMVVEKLKSDTITLTPKSATMSYNIELVKHLPKAMKNTLSSAQPLSIMREFIDEDTQKVSLSHLKQGDKIYAKVTVANMGKINDVVVNQRIPACLSVVNSNITERNEKFKNVNINQKYREIRDDRVLHFIDLAKKEKYDNIAQSHRVIPNQGLIFTPLIVTTEGECQLPAVISEAMYDSRISDYAKEADSIMVGDKSSKPTPTLESKAKTVVQNLYRKEMHSSNAHEFVNLFAYPLSNYYRTKNASKEDVLKDKEKYFKEWTKRVYSNMKLTTTTIDKKSKEVTIKIEFDYVISNSKKELTGVSRHLVTVKEIGGELLISKIKIP